MTTLFACFDKHCYELRPVDASPVSDPCLGETFKNWIGWEQICEEEGHSHLLVQWASVRSVVCRPGRGRTRKKIARYLGRTRWWETRTAALEPAFATKVISQAFDSYSRSRKPSRAIAMLGFLPGRHRDWSDLVRPRWDRRHFSAAKKSTKNHWIVWQCAFKAPWRNMLEIATGMCNYPNGLSMIQSLRSARGATAPIILKHEVKKLSLRLLTLLFLGADLTGLTLYTYDFHFGWKLPQQVLLPLYNSCSFHTCQLKLKTVETHASFQVKINLTIDLLRITP